MLRGVEQLHRGLGHGQRLRLHGGRSYSRKPHSSGTHTGLASLYSFGGPLANPATELREYLGRAGNAQLLFEPACGGCGCAHDGIFQCRQAAGDAADEAINDEAAEASEFLWHLNTQ